VTDNVAANQELKDDFIKYETSIAAEKAAFKATADA